MQLLQNKAGKMGSTFTRFPKFSSAAFGGRFWGSKFRFVRLDFGPGRDYCWGMDCQKIKQNVILACQNLIFFRPAAQVPAAVLWRAVALHETGLPGRGLAGSLGGLSSFYRIRDHSAAFTK